MIADILTVFILFFATLAGQSIAPYLIGPVYALWAALGILAIGRMKVGLPTLLVLGAVGVSVGVNGIENIFGWRRIATVLGYLATYHFLSTRSIKLDRGLAIAGTLMSLLAVGGVIIGNRNVVSGFIVMTIPAALSAWPGWERRWYSMAAGGVAVAMLGSRGAWLAVAVAGIVYSRRYWMSAFAPLLAGLLYVIRPATVAVRVDIWKQALADLSILGRGFGMALYPSGGVTFLHAHCVPLTMAVEAGLPGLAALGVMCWRLVPRLGRGWQGATLAGLLAWSLVDDVVFSWGPGLAAMILLVEVMREA